MDTLRGGTFNLRYGRDPLRVKREVLGLFGKHRLDFLAVQEFTDYRDTFRDTTDYRVIPSGGQCESGTLVRRGITVDRRQQYIYGDGWTTTRGGRFPAAVHNEARLAGWLYLRSVHLPTPSYWADGQLMAPEDRADDLRATMRGLWKYLAHPGTRNAWLAAGDWNEPPGTIGRWSPRWLARTTGSRLRCPTSDEGHGRIDYAIVKGARIPDIYKDTVIPELSDHEPVIFTVRR
jgi:hypothetical protein